MIQGIPSRNIDVRWRTTLYMVVNKKKYCQHSLRMSHDFQHTHNLLFIFWISHKVRQIYHQGVINNIDENISRLTWGLCVNIPADITWTTSIRGILIDPKQCVNVTSHISGYFFAKSLHKNATINYLITNILRV